MHLWLVDINRELVDAWHKEFEGFKNVFIECADILEIAENTIVSPVNSFGFMDGGIDQQYTDYFGLKPQEEVQAMIRQLSDGYLPVGAAVLVKTGNKRIPYLISAPTMVTPGPVDVANVFFAMSAVLKVAYTNREFVNKVYCPGLATGVGCVLVDLAAKEMASAYTQVSGRYNKVL
jgi:O-acetyl-ADP-ribose deacetylase (regulator of RNase III)